MTTSALRVLVVDDEPDLRHLIGRLLKRHDGIEVVGEAGDGEQALRLIDELGPDAVVLDLSMPVLDGLEVLAALERRDASPRVVVLSGFGAGDVAERALSLGATHYLEKGDGFRELADVLLEHPGPTVA